MVLLLFFLAFFLPSFLFLGSTILLSVKCGAGQVGVRVVVVGSKVLEGRRDVGACWPRSSFVCWDGVGGVGAVCVRCGSISAQGSTAGHIIELTQLCLCADIRCLPATPCARVYAACRLCVWLSLITIQIQNSVTGKKCVKSIVLLEELGVLASGHSNGRVSWFMCFKGLGFTL